MIGYCGVLVQGSFLTLHQPHSLLFAYLRSLQMIFYLLMCSFPIDFQPSSSTILQPSLLFFDLSLILLLNFWISYLICHLSYHYHYFSFESSLLVFYRLVSFSNLLISDHFSSVRFFPLDLLTFYLLLDHQGNLSPQCYQKNPTVNQLIFIAQLLFIS